MADTGQLTSSVAAALAVITYIELRVTARVNTALDELHRARSKRRDDPGEYEGRRTTDGET